MEDFTDVWVWRRVRKIFAFFIKISRRIIEGAAVFDADARAELFELSKSADACEREIVETKTEFAAAKAVKKRLSQRRFKLKKVYGRWNSIRSRYSPTIRARRQQRFVSFKEELSAKQSEAAENYLKAEKAYDVARDNSKFASTKRDQFSAKLQAQRFQKGAVRCISYLAAVIFFSLLCLAFVVSESNCVVPDALHKTYADGLADGYAEALADGEDTKLTSIKKRFGGDDDEVADLLGYCHGRKVIYVLIFILGPLPFIFVFLGRGRESVIGKQIESFGPPLLAGLAGIGGVAAVTNPNLSGGKLSNEEVSSIADGVYRTLNADQKFANDVSDILYKKINTDDFVVGLRPATQTTIIEHVKTTVKELEGAIEDGNLEILKTNGEILTKSEEIISANIEHKSLTEANISNLEEQSASLERQGWTLSMQANSIRESMRGLCKIADMALAEHKLTIRHGVEIGEGQCVQSAKSDRNVLQKTRDLFRPKVANYARTKICEVSSSRDAESDNMKKLEEFVAQHCVNL